MTSNRIVLCHRTYATLSGTHYIANRLHPYVSRTFSRLKGNSATVREQPVSSTKGLTASSEQPGDWAGPSQFTVRLTVVLCESVADVPVRVSVRVLVVVLLPLPGLCGCAAFGFAPMGCFWLMALHRQMFFVGVHASLQVAATDRRMRSASS